MIETNAEIVELARAMRVNIFALKTLRKELLKKDSRWDKDKIKLQIAFLSKKIDSMNNPCETISRW